MKKLAGIIAAAVMIFCSGVFVCADVIDDPYYSNDYFEQSEYNSSREVLIFRDSFVYNDPKEMKPVADLKKGDTVYIDYLYDAKDGSRWGGYIYDSEKDAHGLINMENTVRIYDSDTFIEEHREEFDEYNGELYGFNRNDRIVLWKYPSSAEYFKILDSEEQLQNFFWFESRDKNKRIWTDENGSKWVGLYYYRGTYVWIYLTDPCSENIERLDDIIILTENGEKEYASEFLSYDKRLPLILAAACAVVSAAFIFFIKLFRKK